MFGRLAGTIAAIGMSANVVLASPSPLNADVLPTPLIAADLSCSPFVEESTLKRLGGRKRRTPSDFVRQFGSAPATPAAVEIAER